MIHSYIKNLKLPTRTPRIPAADRETIQPNLRCKSTTKFLQQPQDRRKHISRMKRLGRNEIR